MLRNVGRSFLVVITKRRLDINIQSRWHIHSHWQCSGQIICFYHSTDTKTVSMEEYWCTDFSHVVLEHDISSPQTNCWIVRLIDVELADASVCSIKIGNQPRQDLLDLVANRHPIKKQLIISPKDEFFSYMTPLFSNADSRD